MTRYALTTRRGECSEQCYGIHTSNLEERALAESRQLLSRRMSPYPVRSRTERTVIFDKDGATFPGSFDRVSKIFQLLSVEKLTTGFSTRCISPTRVCKESGKKAILPQQTQVTRSPRSTPLTKLLEAAAQEKSRNAESQVRI